MRATLGLLLLFALAVALALFAGNNPGTVTLFWSPWRIDLSLNLFVLALVGAFALLYSALRVLSLLFSLPSQARRWRREQRERAMYSALMNALLQLLAGRFSRAAKAAQLAQTQAQRLRVATEDPARLVQVQALAHLLAAESAHSLQDRAARDPHLAQALALEVRPQAQEVREAILLCAARWSLEENDAAASLAHLQALPHGAARRTAALRIRLRATRQLKQNALALDTARVLVRHRAFAPDSSRILLRSLGLACLDEAHDSVQLQAVWEGLESAERDMPELAIHAALRLQNLGGDAGLARLWLKPVWESYPDLEQPLRLSLVQALEVGLESLDANWLSRIEVAQTHYPRDPCLQYLTGMACLKRQLWGKAQQLLAQAASELPDTRLQRRAWRALAELAERRGDDAAAQQAYRRAALLD